jgi:hypothetical protein
MNENRIDLLTIGLVLRASENDAKRLTDFLTKENIKLVYKTTSWGPLFINRTKHED